MYSPHREPPAHQFTIIWADAWLEDVDEPAGVGVLITGTNHPNHALRLLQGWRILAHQAHGPGVVLITDSQGRRVSAVLPTTSVADAADIPLVGPAPGRMTQARKETA